MNKIEFQLTDQQTDALARMLKRIGYNDVKELTVKESECNYAMTAINQLRIALANAQPIEANQ